MGVDGMFNILSAILLHPYMHLSGCPIKSKPLLWQDVSLSIQFAKRQENMAVRSQGL